MAEIIQFSDYYNSKNEKRNELELDLSYLEKSISNNYAENLSAALTGSEDDWLDFVYGPTETDDGSLNMNRYHAKRLAEAERRFLMDLDTDDDRKIMERNRKMTGDLLDELDKNSDFWDKVLE